MNVRRSGPDLADLSSSSRRDSTLEVQPSATGLPLPSNLKLCVWSCRLHIREKRNLYLRSISGQHTVGCLCQGSLIVPDEKQKTLAAVAFAHLSDGIEPEFWLTRQWPGVNDGEYPGVHVTFSLLTTGYRGLQVSYSHPVQRLRHSACLWCDGDQPSGRPSTRITTRSSV